MQHMQHVQKIQQMQQMQQMHQRHGAGSLSPPPVTWFGAPGKHCARTQALLDSNSQMIMRLAEALAIDDERAEGADPTPEQVNATKAVVSRVRKNVDTLVSAVAEAVRTRPDCRAPLGGGLAMSDDERILIMLGYAAKMSDGDMRLRTTLLQTTERLCLAAAITTRRREIYDVLSCLLQRDMEAPAVHAQVVALLADLISDLQRDTFEVRTYMKRAQDMSLRPRGVTESKIQAYRDGATPVASRYPQFFAGKHAGNVAHASANAFMTGRPLPDNGENGTVAAASQNGALTLRQAGASLTQQQRRQQQQDRQPQTAASQSSNRTASKQLPRFEPSSSREFLTHAHAFFDFLFFDFLNTHCDSRAAHTHPHSSHAHIHASMKPRVNSTTPPDSDDAAAVPTAGRRNQANGGAEGHGAAAASNSFLLTTEVLGAWCENVKRNSIYIALPLLLVLLVPRYRTVHTYRYHSLGCFTVL